MTREEAGDCSLAWLLMVQAAAERKAARAAAVQASIMNAVVGSLMSDNKKLVELHKQFRQAAE